jgi:hypothetical protein
MTALGLFLTAAYSAALGSPDYAVREAVTRRLSRDGFGLVVARHGKKFGAFARSYLLARAYLDLRPAAWCDDETAAFWSATPGRRLLIESVARAAGLLKSNEAVGWVMTVPNPDGTLGTTDPMAGWINVMRKRANGIPVLI